MTIHRARPAVAFAGLLLASLTGCGGGTTTVKGKVSYDGKPVVWGTVTLVDEAGQFHQGPIGLDGTYTIENVPLGTVQIGVYSSKPIADPPKDLAPPPSDGIEDPRAKYKAARQAADAAIPKPAEGAWFPLPDKFSDPASSGQTGEVKKGVPLDIDLRNS